MDTFAIYSFDLCSKLKHWVVFLFTYGDHLNVILSKVVLDEVHICDLSAWRLPTHNPIHHGTKQESKHEEVLPYWSTPVWFKKVWSDSFCWTSWLLFWLLCGLFLILTLLSCLLILFFFSFFVLFFVSLWAFFLVLMLNWSLCSPEQFLESRWNLPTTSIILLIVFIRPPNEAIIELLKQSWLNVLLGWWWWCSKHNWWLCDGHWPAELVECLQASLFVYSC